MSGESGIELLSWNINGIRAVRKYGFDAFLKKRKPDICCLQETRTPGDDLGICFEGYNTYWNHAEKKGYSGTAILTRKEPLQISKGMGRLIKDTEGRVLTAEYKGFFLVNVYVPNAKRDLSRLEYRQKEWDPAFAKYIRRLAEKKPVIFCGDMNVAHQEIDLSNPKANVKNHGFTPEERAGFTDILGNDFLDSFRVFNQKPEFYTWWSRLGNCRARNVGWRIDYFGISKVLRPKLKKAFILDKVMGSDHCPVGIKLSKSLI